MIQISLPYIVDVATKLEDLKRVQAGIKFGDIFLDVFFAKSSLSDFLKVSVFSPYLRTSHQSGNLLLTALEQLLEKTADAQVEVSDQYSIGSAYEKYKIALLAEMETLPAYFVTQQGGYDTLTLLNSPIAIFPLGLPNKVPEAMFDVAESAKCLAFGVGTAAGFHIFRVTESVLRRYYSLVTSGLAQPKVRSIRVYVKAMRQADKGDPKVLHALDQLADLHRNPLIHPEVALDPEEAIAILGMAYSAISAMLAVLPDVPTTTTAPSSV